MPTPTPIGTVLLFAGETGSSSVTLSLAAQGWLVCDGSKYPTSSPLYKPLHDVIGYSHGGGAGKFCVPSFKGRFLRGVDDETHPRDPDAKKRDAPRPSLEHPGNRGALVGSVQNDTFEEHTHPYDEYGTLHKADHVAAHDTLKKGSTSCQMGDTHGGGGGDETRPKNIYVNYIIKYTDTVDIIPLGAILPFSGDEVLAEAQIASGWLPCDGRELGGDVFDDLQAVIEDYYGATKTEFCLPDFRGYFLRGVQGQVLPHMKAVDPNAASRTAPRSGLEHDGNTGNRVGSVQVDDFKTHKHAYDLNSDYQWTAATLIGFHAVAHDGGSSSYDSGDNGTLAETRPDNINSNFIIKTLDSEPPPNHCYQPGDDDCCFCAFGSMTGLGDTESRTTMMSIEKGCDLMQFILVDPHTGDRISIHDMTFTLVRPDGTTISSTVQHHKDGLIVDGNQVLVEKPQAGMWLIDVQPAVSTPFWFFGMCVPTSGSKDPQVALEKLLQDVNASPAGKASMTALAAVLGIPIPKVAEDGLEGSGWGCFTCEWACYGIATAIVIATVPEDALVAPAIIVVAALGVQANRNNVIKWMGGMKNLSIKKATKTLCEYIGAC